MNYTPYHIHSDISNGTTNIDSINKYWQYIDKAKEYGMTAFGFSEHGSIFNWVKKKRAIEAAGMKYIHAMEAYITEDEAEKTSAYVALMSDEELEKHGLSKRNALAKVSFTEKTEQNGRVYAKDINTREFVEIDKHTIRDDGYKKTRDNYHCVLIARNEKGKEEINKLHSRSWNRQDGYHFYFVPRITMSELLNTSDNVIITTACLGGILNEGTTTAKEKFLTFLAKNKHRCFLEIQHHNCEEQIVYNQMLWNLSKELGIPLIAGTDAHILSEDYIEARHILQESKKVHFPNEDQWDLVFKSYDELVDAYETQGSLPMDVVLEAIENTNRMADMVEEFSLDETKKYPSLYGEKRLGILAQKIKAGWQNRKIGEKPNHDVYAARVQTEWDTYIKNEAVDFILLEEDYKSAMRKKGVRFGYSRGSVSGSIICYLLGITEVDSVRYDLNFERFMNPERVSLADIDTDWYSEDEPVVKHYLYNKEGLYCADILTLNTIALKGSIRDVSRGLEIPLNEVNAICDSVEDNLEQMREEYPRLFTLVDKVQGVITSVGNHPAGCVVSPEPLEGVLGTFTTATDEYPIVALDMKEVDSLNYVKLDILKLDTVGLIYKTCDLAGIPYATPDNIPPDDQKVWKSIRDDTTMIFQWESPMATAYVKKLFSDKTISKIRLRNKNLSYIDLFAIGNGALRPAGASYRDKLAEGNYENRHNKVLNDFLAPTMGQIVYQEQVMEFLHQFCGFTMGEADIVRRGFAKKTGTEKYIPVIKNGGYLSDAPNAHYIKGFVEIMYDEYKVPKEESEELATSFLQVIADASDYLFSKNHSVPYSWIGYICGYLRYYYPLEFITTALNICRNDFEKTSKIIAYAKTRKISIQPIRFRKSRGEYMFDRETNSIYKGLLSIKKMNSSVPEELYNLRSFHYDDFIDLLIDIQEKTVANKSNIEALIDLGYFQEFGDPDYLRYVYRMYRDYSTRRELPKDNLPPEFDDVDMSKFCERETAKRYVIGKNMIPLIREAAKGYDGEHSFSLAKAVARQIEHLGYVDIQDEKYTGCLVVQSVNTAYTPMISVYALRNGNQFRCKIAKTYFNKPKHKLRAGDIIKVTDKASKFKKKFVSQGVYQTLPEKEIWLKEYTILGNYLDCAEKN